MGFHSIFSFYRSQEWSDLRTRLMLERTNGDGLLLCARCGKPIVRPYDCIAHHKTELTEENVQDYDISLNPENIELIHFRCHNLEHERFEGFRQRVFIVYGPPCAGKTTWVMEQARDDDLIVDIDRIWEAVCKADRLHKPNRLKQNVFGIHQCMIEQIKIRKGNWRTAYVIGGYPLQSERERLADLLGAELIFIDTDEETCISRAPDENWIAYIKDWFDCHR